MWSSRNNLTISAIILLFFIVLLRRSCDDLPDIAIIESELSEGSSFLGLIHQAKEEIDYLYDSLKGTAVIAPVVEKERILEVESSCRKLRATDISIAPKHLWVNASNWFLFSAHLDKRENSLYPKKSSIQILAAHYSQPSQAPYCLIRYSDGSTTIVKAVLREIWQRAWDPRFSFYNSFLVTCGLPDDLRPVAVTLVPSKCSTIINKSVPVQDNSQKLGSKQPSVAVCLKGLDFMEDRSQYIVEWIEFQLLMGADKIGIYVYSITAGTRKAIEHYMAQGKVELIDLSLPGYSPNTPFIRHNYISRNRQQKRRSELIPYNDCFYRFSQSHDFVLIVDSDEFVVPLKHRSWPEMLASIPNLHNSSSLAIRNVFKLEVFDSNSTSKVNILRVNMRSKTVQDKGVSEKSFINTRTIASVFNHFALHRLSANVTRTQHVTPEIAIKLHYKPKCPEELGLQCQEIISEPILDVSLHRFALLLEKRITKALSDIRTT